MFAFSVGGPQAQRNTLRDPDSWDRLVAHYQLPSITYSGAMKVDEKVQKKINDAILKEDMIDEHSDT